MTAVDKLRIREAIAVEGRYDAHAVRAVFDTVVVELGGFGVYHDAALRAELARLASTCGLILLTDSDPAGFMIRARVAECAPPGTVRHAYVPDVPGVERRKKTPGAAGLLGVEGMPPAVIRQAVLAAGATVEGAAAAPPPKSGITRARFYEDGFFGRPDSASRRDALKARLGLPARLSVSALLNAMNRLITAEEYESLVRELAGQAPGGDL